jgi:hypothetical protein
MIESLTTAPFPIVTAEPMTDFSTFPYISVPSPMILF